MRGDHRAVQVARRPGLQRILSGRAVGARGRASVALPSCMGGLPQGRVALAAGVPDPWRHWRTRAGWEERTVSCAAPEEGDGVRQRRRVPQQVNARGEDMTGWPADCAVRAAMAALPAEAACGSWEAVFDGCHAPLAAPSATPGPAPDWRFRNVGFAKSGSGSCPSGWSGAARWTEQWERRELNKEGAGWVVVARRQKPGEARVWDHGGCSDTGTGACPSGQTGAATWTQTYGQARVWDYGGCRTPVDSGGNDQGNGEDGSDHGGDDSGGDDDEGGSSGGGNTGGNTGGGHVGGMGGYHGPSDEDSGVSPGDPGHGSNSGDDDSGNSSEEGSPADTGHDF